MDWGLFRLAYSTKRGRDENPMVQECDGGLEIRT
jgi:hypothetical protein